MRILHLKGPAGAKELHERLDNMDAVAVSCDSAASLEEFELAYHLAKRAFDNKTNIAKKMKYEFLLWLGGKTDIASAMRETAPTTAREKTSEASGSEGAGEFFVVLFSDSEREGGKVSELLDAKELPLKLRKKAEPLALERISLSRII